MWFNLAIESSPFRQVPSLGLFPCSLGWLFVGGEEWFEILDTTESCCGFVLMFALYFRNVAWFHLSPALFLPNAAVLCCAELHSHGSAGRAHSSVEWQDLCHSTANVHWRGFSCRRTGPDLALAKLSWSSSRAQCVLTVMHGVEAADSFLQLCNRSSHDEVHINYFKVKWKHCENIPRVVVCPLWGRCHLH